MYAKDLGDVTFLPVAYQTGSPYQRRTVEIPDRLRIPEPEYAVTCIENRTKMDVNYSGRWGNGAWQPYSVRPGELRWHSWRYEGGQHSSPDLNVKFDFDLSGQNKYRSYRLIRKSMQRRIKPQRKEILFRRPGKHAGST